MSAKSTKGMLLLCAALFLAACAPMSATSSSSNADPVKLLEEMGKSPDEQKVSDLLSAIAAQTLKEHGESVLLLSQIHQEVPQWNDGWQSIPETRIQADAWVLKDNELIEILRSQQSEQMPAYVSLSRYDKSKETKLSLLLQDEDEVFSSSPQVVLSDIESHTGTMSEDLNDAQVYHFLQGLQESVFRPLFGHSLSLPFSLYPSLYDFSFSKENGGYLLSILLKSPQSYDDQSRKSQMDGYQRMDLQPQAITNDWVQFQLELDEKGSLTEAMGYSTQTLTFDTGSVSLSSSLKTQVLPYDASDELESVEEIFTQADQQQILKQSVFVLGLDPVSIESIL